MRGAKGVVADYLFYVCTLPMSGTEGGVKWHFGTPEKDRCLAYANRNWDCRD